MDHSQNNTLNNTNQSNFIGFVDDGYSSSNFNNLQPPNIIQDSSNSNYNDVYNNNLAMFSNETTAQTLQFYPTITSSYSSYAPQYNVGHPQNSPQYDGNIFAPPISQTNHSETFSFEISGFKISISITPITPISHPSHPTVNNLQQDHSYYSQTQFQQRKFS